MSVENHFVITGREDTFYSAMQLMQTPDHLFSKRQEGTGESEEGLS